MWHKLFFFLAITMVAGCSIDKILNPPFLAGGYQQDVGSSAAVDSYNQDVYMNAEEDTQPPVDPCAEYAWVKQGPYLCTSVVGSQDCTLTIIVVDGVCAGKCQPAFFHDMKILVREGQVNLYDTDGSVCAPIE